MKSGRSEGKAERPPSSPTNMPKKPEIKEVDPRLKEFFKNNKEVFNPDGDTLQKIQQALLTPTSRETQNRKVRAIFGCSSITARTMVSTLKTILEGPSGYGKSGTDPHAALGDGSHPHSTRS